MLKEVGASGQISLGKRLAGQLFEVIFHPDGRVELLPMRAVPARNSARAAQPASGESWRPPGGYASSSAWAQENRDALEAYARTIEQEGTAAQQLQRYLDSGEADVPAGA
jgi:hypothetical protein